MPSTLHKLAGAQRAILVLLACLASLCFAVPAGAATISVNETADENNADGDCSLREAVRSANLNSAQDGCSAGSGADTINVPAGFYQFSIAGLDNTAQQGDLDLTGTVTIDGAGRNQTFIDADGLDRVFHALIGSTVELTDLSVRNGYLLSDGGAGLRGDSSNLTLRGVSFFGNSTGSGNGGGIHSQGGSVTASDSAFVNNFGDGGGLSTNGATVVLTDVLFANNDGSGGAGIYQNGGTLTANRLTLLANGAGTAQGGGADLNGNFSITDSVIAQNFVNNVGAGLHVRLNPGQLGTLTDVTLTANRAESTSADTGGGGIHVSGGNEGEVRVSQSVFKSNEADRGAGLEYGSPGGGLLRIEDSTFDGNQAQATVGGMGGAISNWSNLEVERSTLSGNSAYDGDGIANNNGSDATITNSTISDNGTAVFGQGGGLFNVGDATLQSVTLAENLSASSGGGNIYNYVGLGAVTSLGSLIYRGIGGNCAGDDPLDGPANTGGDNLEVTPNESCGFDPVDTIGEFALTLGPLANNGGFTKTRSIAGNEAAADGAGTSCTDEDQRGIFRPQGPACDVGAFEIDLGDGPPAPPGGGNPDPGTPAPSGQGGSTGSSGGTGADTRKPKASLSGSTKQRLLKQKSVKVTVQTDEAGKLTAAGSLTVPGASKTYKLKSVSKTAQAGKRYTLKLKLSKKQLRAIRKALGRKKKVRAKLTVTAADGAGNASAVKRTVRAKK